MRSRIGQTVDGYVKEHFSLYLFTTILFMMGVVFGAVVVNSLGLSQKKDLFQYLSEFFRVIGQGEALDSQVAFRESFAHYLKSLGLIWMLGLSIIGLPLILIVIFLKGLVIGFTVGFLVHQLQWEGLSFAFVSVVPQNLLVVPALIIAGVAGISFSLKLIRSRFFQRGRSLWTHFFSYTMLVFAMVFVLAAASLLEAFVSPVLMQKMALMLIE